MVLPFRPLFAFALAALLAPAAQAAETPGRYCLRAKADDAPRPIPRLLVPAARHVFGLDAPDAILRRTTVFRCVDGAILLCNTGANLPCGRANTSRNIVSAGRYCREHPDSPGIPAYVTGHDTIYTWRCRGAKAIAGEPIEVLDGRGFVARLWKRLE